MATPPLALTPDHVPLGLLQQQVWARDPLVVDADDHTTRPIDDKERLTWLTSLQAAITTRTLCPTSQIVSVGDRQADVYDLFVVAGPVGVDLLVRAAHNRKAEHPDTYLWAAMATAAVAATVDVHIGKRAAQPARNATLTVRWRQITLCPPVRRSNEHVPNVTV